MRSLLLATLTAAAFSLAAPSAEAARPSSGFSTPADFEMINCWGTSTFDSGCPWTESILHADGTWEHVTLHLPGLGDLDYTIYGTWELRRGGRELVIVFEDTTVTTTWVGESIGGGCFEGTMSDTSTTPNSGVWQGCVVN
ncbi:MAG: hypothetical protein H6741_08155 [Alphaproteobacteria bacterium]|nr:hypothetical protein [Alphaproteobacteria bacterium]